MQDSRVKSDTRDVEVWVQPSLWVEVAPVRITTCPQGGGQSPGQRK